MAADGQSNQPSSAGKPLGKPARHGRSATLIQTEGPGAPREFILGESDAIVGRHSRATIPVLTHRAEDESAVIRYRQEEFFIHDTPNSVVFFLNVLPFHSALLLFGVLFRFASLLFVFRYF